MLLLLLQHSTETLKSSSMMSKGSLANSMIDGLCTADYLCKFQMFGYLYSGFRLFRKHLLNVSVVQVFEAAADMWPHPQVQ